MVITTTIIIYCLLDINYVKNKPYFLGNSYFDLHTLIISYFILYDNMRLI